jgi:hypothetical protein
MHHLKILILTIGAMAVALPVSADMPTLAGAPSHAQNYKSQNGVKVYRFGAAPQTSAEYGRNVRRLSSLSHSTLENGVKVHRLMQAPTFLSNQNGHSAQPFYENRILQIKKKAQKQRKKAFKKGYSEGYQDGYQTAQENQRTRRPIRLRQRIRTRPRVSQNVLDRRNLQ